MTSQHGRCFYVILKGLGYLNFKKHVSAFRVKKGGVYFEGVQKKVSIQALLAVQPMYVQVSPLPPSHLLISTKFLFFLFVNSLSVHGYTPPDVTEKEGAGCVWVHELYHDAESETGCLPLLQSCPFNVGYRSCSGMTLLSAV
jgi:hypothetical protein